MGLADQLQFWALLSFTSLFHQELKRIGVCMDNLLMCDRSRGDNEPADGAGGEGSGSFDPVLCLSTVIAWPGSKHCRAEGNGGGRRHTVAATSPFYCGRFSLCRRCAVVDVREKRFSFLSG